MFSKEETKQLKLDFWTGLGERLELEKGLHGNKVNWMSFNTKIKHLYFRMEVDEMAARLCIDLQFPDQGIREIYFEQFTAFENILTEKFEAKIHWQPVFMHSNGKKIARISVQKKEVNIYNRNDWEDIYLFLINHFTKLEHFWAEFSEVFTSLKD